MVRNGCRRRSVRAALVLILAALPVRAWDFAWLTQFGTRQTDALLSVAADGTGVYTAGNGNGALGPTPRGGFDAFVRKYDRAGALLWTIQFGTPAADGAFDVVADSSGVYVAGSTFGRFPGETPAGIGDLFVRKLTPDGHELWTTQFGTSGNELPVIAQMLAVHPTGVYVTGATTGAFPGEINRGAFDVLLAKLDPSTGDVLWVRQFGTPGSDISGTLFGGVAADETGAYVVANLFPAPETVVSEFRKYDHAGNLLWSRAVGRGACSPAVTGLAAHASGIYVAGQDVSQPYEPGAGCAALDNSKSIAGIVIRHDRDGNEIWTRSTEGAPRNRSGFTGAKGIAVFDSGVYLSGNLTESLAGDTSEDADGSKTLCAQKSDPFFGSLDAYVRRYDFDGNVIWTRQVGGPDFDIAWDLASDGTTLFIGGQTDCIVDPGQTFFGGSDGFVGRIEINPASATGRIQLIVGGLETFLAAGHVDENDFHSLLSDLEAALGGLLKSHVNVARNNLQSFVGQVADLEASGGLPASDAAALTDAANAVLQQL